MIIKHYQGGDSFIFTAEPQDANGDSVEPTAMTLYLNFRSGSTSAVDGRENSGAIVMTLGTAGLWSGYWTSRGIGALAGRVYWSIQTENPDSNEQGSFDLDINLANPGD